MKAQVATAREYFFKCISIHSSLMPPDFQLTYKEIMFLVECCMYNYEGNDLTDIDALGDLFTERRFFKRKADVSIYKYKLGVKRWAKTGRKEFTLPPMLDKRKGDKLSSSILIEYGEAKI